jgi:hypothetical protein
MGFAIEDLTSNVCVCVCVSFCEFSQPYEEKNMEIVKGTKGFVLEKKGPSCHIRYKGRKILRSPY